MLKRWHMLTWHLAAVVLALLLILAPLPRVHPASAEAQAEPGVVLLEDSLTAPGVVLTWPCPTNRNSTQLVGEGSLLKVTGKCHETDTSAGVSGLVAGVSVPDGEVRLELRAVSGQDRVGFVLLFRVPPTDEPGGSYFAYIHPGLGFAGLVRLTNGQGTILASRDDLAGRLAPDGWNSVAVRAQGPNLHVLVNDELIMSATDSTYDTGGVRIGVFRLGDPDHSQEAALVLRNLRVSGLATADQARAPTYWGQPALGAAAPAPLPPPSAAAPPQPAPSQPPVAAALAPAWDTLTGVGRNLAGGETVGAFMRRTVEETGVRLVVGQLPAGVNGQYQARENMITLNQNLLGEDRRAIAAVLAHELLHAYQVSRGLGGRRDCVRMEVDAYGFEAVVWTSFWQQGRGPSRTPLEQQLSRVALILAREGEPGLYRLVVSEPGYQAQCELWVP